MDGEFATFEPEQGPDPFHLLGPVDDLGVLGIHVFAKVQ